jgi:WD40 repeat protein
VTVWRIADRFRVSRLQAGHQPVNDCALWRDGRLLATASGDGIIRLWAVEGGAPAGVLRGHDG